MVKKAVDYVRRDVVLTISLCLAALSCLIKPPSVSYLGYIDFNTLIILFCLMLIVEGLRELHTALAGGSWCGAERQRGGGSGSVLM